MTGDLQLLVDALRAGGIHVRPIGSDPDVWVVSHERINFPDSGNSFWVALKRGEWLISTFMPDCWRVPAGTDLPTLCAECLDSSRTAIYEIPAEMVVRYGLTRVADDEFDALFPPEPDADEG